MGRRLWAAPLILWTPPAHADFTALPLSPRRHGSSVWSLLSSWCGTAAQQGSAGCAREPSHWHRLETTIPLNPCGHPSNATHQPPGPTISTPYVTVLFTKSPSSRPDSGVCCFSLPTPSRPQRDVPPPALGLILALQPLRAQPWSPCPHVHPHANPGASILGSLLGGAEALPTLAQLLSTPLAGATPQSTTLPAPPAPRHPPAVLRPSHCPDSLLQHLAAWHFLCSFIHSANSGWVSALL